MSYAITKRSSSASHDLSHTLILVIPISLWEAPENLSHWPSWWVSCLDQRLVAVLGQHWEESRLCSIYLTGLWDILHIHIFLVAPLCVCRQGFFSHKPTNICSLFLRWTKFSTERVVGHWTRFFREVVPAPILVRAQDASGQFY